MSGTRVSYESLEHPHSRSGTSNDPHSRSGTSGAIIKLFYRKTWIFSKTKFQNGFYVTKLFQRFIHLINLSMYHHVLLPKA